MISEELVKTVSGEEEADRIYKADLSNKLLIRISGLNHFSKLRFLRLDFNRIRCIENLESLPDLRQLHLQSNQLTQINGLKGNKMLTVLNLSSNFIEKIENLSHLYKLETLLLDENEITKIVNLETLKTLKVFSISKNKLQSIDSMPAFSKLQNFNASFNSISKIPNNLFEPCAKLIQLNLSYNKLKNLAFLHPLSGIEAINLQSNEIIEFPKLHFKNLQQLNLNSNQLQTLPKISDCCPELTELFFKDNYICSDYEVIHAVSESDFLSQIDFRGNPMHNEEFQRTLYDLYGFDLINEKTFGQPGTRFKDKASNIQQNLRNYLDIEDDEEDRKIKMSGFYDDNLEEEITGMASNRPNSPSKKKTTLKINFNEIQKSYNEIIRNDKKIEELRTKCQDIFKSNNIIPEEPMLEREEKIEKPQIILTQVKFNENKILEPAQIKKITEEEANKWKQLKAKQKNFNIRGVIRRNSETKKMAASKNSSISKQQKQELMKTQAQPPRWNADPALLKTFGRPFSARKKKDN